MRSRLPFCAADAILQHATSVKLTLHLDEGQFVGIAYQVDGEVLSPFDDLDGQVLDDRTETARRLVEHLMKGGAS